jgi:hypothetical protein
MVVEDAAQSEKLCDLGHDDCDDPNTMVTVSTADVVRNRGGRSTVEYGKGCHGAV